MYRILAIVSLGALAAAFLPPRGGVARAQAACEPERPPAERAVDCLDFAAKRFRIPAGHFVPWYQADAAGKMKLVFPAGKSEFSYFVIGAVHPDLTPPPELVDVRKHENFQAPQGADAEKSGVLAVVNLGKNLRVATTIDLVDGEFVFAETLVSTLLAHGCKQTDAPAPAPAPLSIQCPASKDNFVLYRRQNRVTHFTLEAPGREEYVCIVPYSTEIYLAVQVTDDLKDQVCPIGYRLRDKLRSFEY